MSTIRYEFVAAGYQSVVGAYQSISKAAREASRDASALGAAQERAARAPAARASRGASDAEKQAAVQERMAERVAKRSADMKIREEERAAAYVYKIQQRYFNQQQREEEQAARRRAQEYERQGEKIRAAFRLPSRGDTLGTGVAGLAGKAMFGVGGAVLGGAMAAGGAFMGITGAAARESMQLQDIATRIAINARGSGEKLVDPTVLRKEFENAAIANPGVKATDVAEGVASYVAKTGDLASARASLGTFATLASASGSSVKDVSGAGAELFQKFKINNSTEMQKSLAALYFQGKSGAFELSEAAALFPRVGAAGQRFGLGEGAGAVKTLGGFMQLARSATGSGEEAATAVEAMFRALLKEKKVKDLVFEKGSNTKTRALTESIPAIIAKYKGSLPAMQDIFDDRGIRAVSPLISAFNEARNSTKGTEAEKTAAGIKALQEAIEKAINAPGEWSEVVQDAATAQRTSSSTLTAAWEKVKAVVGDRFAPKIAEILGKIAADPKAIDLFIAAVGHAAEALDAFAHYAQKLGLIKGETPTEVAANAQKRIAEIDKELGGMTGKLTPEQERQQRLLITERSMLAEKSATAFQDALAGASDERQALVRQAFIQRMVAAGKQDSVGRAASQEMAETLFDEARARPFDDRDFARGGVVLSLLNDKQRAELQGLQGYEQGAGGYAGFDPQGMVTAAKAIEAAGLKAAEAISKAKPNGTLTGHGEGKGAASQT